MPQIICIKRSGDIKSFNVSSLTSFPINLEKLSKSDRKLLKTVRHYSCECDFTLHDYTVTILGKTDGKTGTENKKELPPPIDNEIYFGNVYAVAHNNGSYKDLSVEDFEGFYIKAFGGFEDLGNEDSWSEEDEENTEDREFINDESESPKKYSEEDEYEFTEEEETTEDEVSEIVNDLGDVDKESNDIDTSDDYKKGFMEGKKYYCLVQQFLRELDNSLPKRRKQFYTECPQKLAEIIYSNQKNKKNSIIQWLEIEIKSVSLKNMKQIYKKVLKRYKEDFMSEQ